MSEPIKAPAVDLEAEVQRVRMLLHDINNHLGVVVSHLDLMADNPDLPDHFWPGINESMEASLRVAELIREMQQITRARDARLRGA